MTLSRQTLLFAAAMFVWAGTATAQEYVTNAAEIVKAADWKKMETVTIEMGEQGEKLWYNPKEVKLKANQPYKLVLVNKGKKKHYFTAEQFYRSMALRKVETKDGEVKAPYITAIELKENGGTVEIYAVPVKSGTYDVICTIDDHKDRGMFGTIVVE